MSLNTAQAAEKLGTDPKTFRKFLRKSGLGVGKGARYSLEARDVAKMKKAFSEWSAAQENEKAEAKVSRAKVREEKMTKDPAPAQDPNHNIIEQNTTGRATS